MVTEKKTRKIFNVEVFKDNDGLWRDRWGCIYSASDPELAADSEVQLGVGPLSLPKSNPLTPADVAHGFAYSSREYQAANPRSKADRLFLDTLLLLSGDSRLRRGMSYGLYGVVRSVGWLWWENKETRWK